MANNDRILLGLDVGRQRIGVARAIPSVGLASPLVTLQHGEDIFADIAGLYEHEGASGLVVGLPRNLNGDSTEQTAYTEAFAASLRSALDAPLYFQDEALTSEKAEEELKARKKPYQKGDIDALAAALILEDFMKEPPKEFVNG